MGITPVLTGLLTDAGFVHVKHKAYGWDVSFHNEEENHQFLEGLLATSRRLDSYIQRNLGEVEREKFLAKMEQAKREIQLPDFRGIVYFLIAWGEKPYHNG